MNEKSFLFNERYGINATYLELKLTIGAPLFGFDKEELLTVDTGLKPQNGDLVVFSSNDHNEVYRFETSNGFASLWPGNTPITETEANQCYVILKNAHIAPKFDISAYLIG